MNFLGRKARGVRAAALALIGSACVGSPCLATDEVIFWNNVLLQAYREDFGTGCPCPLSRAGAMTQIAVYEAVNSIDRTHLPYWAFVEAPADASKEAAVAAAAHGVMSAVFLNSTATLDATYAARLALLADGAAKDAGIAAGEAAAAMILAVRAGDHADEEVPYVFGSNPGDYQPTSPSDFVCNNHWTNVSPFCMAFGQEYRLAPGPYGYTVMADFLASPEYAADFNEVKEYGARDSAVRTDEQTRIAFFWANDLNGTYKPPGHLFSITQTVSADHSLTLTQNARLFALVAMAMGDAAIVAWDMKYATNIDLWRPITAIRLADLDGNPATEKDEDWLELNPFSPPFPAWTSGHATFGGAHAGVMAEYFGTDDVTFTITSEDPYYNDLPEHPARTFHKFSDAAWENAISRVYLGVHYRVDAVDGNRTGLALGRAVAQNFLRPLCKGDINSDAFVNGDDFDTFTALFDAGNLNADFDGNGFVNGDDYDLFVYHFESGC